MSKGEEQAVTIPVLSKDPPKPEDKPADGKGAKQTKDEKSKAEELSEQDAQLKEELEMLVQRLHEDQTDLYRPALESLRALIRTSTSSMTSVPKPLKFLRPHFSELELLFDKFAERKPDQATENLFADILSVLAMTYSDTGKRDTLKYRLRTAGKGDEEDPGSWGHEYVRHLASELGEEFNARQEAYAAELDSDEPLKVPQELLDLALRLVPFFMNHNGEPDAVDLLLELEHIEGIIPFVDENSYARVCSYMVACVNLLVPPDDRRFLQTARQIYRKQGRFTEAITLAMRLNDMDLIVEDFQTPSNASMQRQLAYLLARQQVTLPAEILQKLEEDESPLLAILNNASLSTHFKDFCKTLSLLEPKSLEDVYKSHLDDNPSSRAATGTANIDSARQNLAGTFVNAFVNVGCANDKLMIGAEEGQSWIYKNKDDGMLSAAASLGLLLLWDPEMGLSQIDKYSYASEEHIKAGALLANGIIHSGIKTEMDAAIALLGDYVENKSVPLRTMATIGLGIAYAGSAREDLADMLSGSIGDTSVSMEVSSLAALALGFVFVGSGNGEVAGTILQAMMEREDKDLNEKWAKFMGLGLALLFLGKQDESEITAETLKAIEHPIAQQTLVLLDALSYAGTGNVLKIQTMLHYCNDHLNVPTKDDETGDNAAAGEANGTGAAAEGENAESGAPPAAGADESSPTASGATDEAQPNGTAEDAKSDEPTPDTHQAFAVLGLALIAMGEDVGAQMSLRSLNHLMFYGEPVIRRAVPLALGLLSASNPQLTILDTLSRYSHDNDLDVAMNAIFAMGLVGAGSNQAKLAQMLRQLAVYYQKEADCLFVVRIAQGLVHMGKGLVTVNPAHTDRFLMSPTAIAGLLSTIIAFTDARNLILEKTHWMLYFLTMAMYPRFLVTFDEVGEPLPVSVRVGTAVDVVGQAGKPRTISGFATHQTPVRMAHIERAELATEEYFSYSHILEGLVILKKNEQFEKEDAAATAAAKQMDLS